MITLALSQVRKTITHGGPIMSQRVKFQRVEKWAAMAVSKELEQLFSDCPELVDISSLKGAGGKVDLKVASAASIDDIERIVPGLIEDLTDSEHPILFIIYKEGWCSICGNKPGASSKVAIQNCPHLPALGITNIPCSTQYLIIDTRYLIIDTRKIKKDELGKV